MSTSPIRILLVEDNDADARRIAGRLMGDDGFALVVRVESLRAAGRRLDGGGFDAVLLDLTLPDTTGLDAIGRLQERAPEVPIIVVHDGLDGDALPLARARRRGAAPRTFCPRAGSTRRCCGARSRSPSSASGWSGTASASRGTTS